MCFVYNSVAGRSKWLGASIWQGPLAASWQREGQEERSPAERSKRVSESGLALQGSLSWCQSSVSRALPLFSEKSRPRDLDTVIGHMGFVWCRQTRIKPLQWQWRETSLLWKESCPLCSYKLSGDQKSSVFFNLKWWWAELSSVFSVYSVTPGRGLQQSADSSAAATARSWCPRKRQRVGAATVTSKDPMGR